VCDLMSSMAGDPSFRRYREASGLRGLAYQVGYYIPFLQRNNHFAAPQYAMICRGQRRAIPSRGREI
jgi:hypothetical protein